MCASRSRPPSLLTPARARSSASGSRLSASGMPNAESESASPCRFHAIGPFRAEAMCGPPSNHRWASETTTRYLVENLTGSKTWNYEAAVRRGGALLLFVLNIREPDRSLLDRLARVGTKAIRRSVRLSLRTRHSLHIDLESDVDLSQAHSHTPASGKVPRAQHLVAAHFVSVGSSSQRSLLVRIRRFPTRGRIPSP